jgi:phosphoglycolate phosphatase-like HAD superfamily hydrolase
VITPDLRLRAVRNIIWDVDGTLFDTYPAIARAFNAALHDLGQDAPLERISELACESLGHCAATLASDFGLDRDALEAAFDLHYGPMPPEDSPPFPGVADVCRHIASIGGQNLIVTHRGPRGTAELLAAGGLTDYFAACITAADGYPRKPDPAAFEAVIERSGLRRDETLAIGDRDIDVLAGKAAGLATCLFGRPASSAAPDLVIATFSELGPILGMPDR